MIPLADQARALRGQNQVQTVKAVERWIRQNVTWRAYNAPRGVPVTYAQREGDCTDMAQLAQEMLSVLGIRSRTVHGLVFPNGGIGGARHDWLIATVHTSLGNEDRVVDPAGPWDRYQYIGPGVWRD